MGKQRMWTLLLHYGHQYGDEGNMSWPKCYTTDVFSPSTCDRLDWLYNWWDPVQNENAGLLDQYSFEKKKSRWQQQCIKPSTGSCAAASPGNGTRREL